MTNKIIKFTLEANGTIPTYMNSGGFYPKANDNSSPQDWDMIGATKDGASETGLGELANKAAVESYLDSYTGDWTEKNDAGEDVAFSQANAATYIWTKKTS